MVSGGTSTVTSDAFINHLEAEKKKTVGSVLRTAQPCRTTYVEVMVLVGVRTSLSDPSRGTSRMELFKTPPAVSAGV